MKSLFCKLLLPALILALILSGCQQTVPEAKIEEKTVYTSFFPFYALADGLFADVPNMNLRCLVQPQDGCLRGYELSEWDIAKISGADAVIIGGRSMESFEGLLTGLSQGPSVIVALDALSLLQQDQPVSDEDQSHFLGQNPWAFLSPGKAAQITEAIANGMIALDPGFEQVYAQNCERRLEALEALEAKMQQILIGENPQPVALMHEGLPYLADSLGLYVTAVVEREPGTALYGADMDEALRKLESGGVRVVLLEKQAPDLLRTRLAEAGYELALIDTFSTFPSDIGTDYYDLVMERNARAVADAFRACK